MLHPRRKAGCSEYGHIQVWSANSLEPDLRQYFFSDMLSMKCCIDPLNLRRQTLDLLEKIFSGLKDGTMNVVFH